MGKTIINLSKQASGLTLNLGTEGSGEVSKLTLYTGAETHESTVLEAKGTVKVAGKLSLEGVTLETSAITSGQTLVMNGGSLKPTSVLEGVFKYLSTTDGSIDTIEKLDSYNTIILRDGVDITSASGNTLYAPELDILGNLNISSDVNVEGSTYFKDYITSTGKLIVSGATYLEKGIRLYGTTTLHDHITTSFDPYGSDNAVHKKYVDDLAANLNSIQSGASVAMNFRVEPTLANRNNIPQSERIRNLHVAVQEGSTNELMVGGKTHIMPRIFVLVPLVTSKLYIGGDSLVGSPIGRTLPTVYDIQMTEVRNANHPQGAGTTSPLHSHWSIPLSAMPETIVNPFGNVGFYHNQGSVNGVLKYEVYENYKTYGYIPEVGQTVDVYDVINNERVLVATWTTNSKTVSSNNFTQYTIQNIKYTNVYNEETVNLMGTGDQSDVWIEKPFYKPVDAYSKQELEAKLSELDAAVATTKLVTITGAKNSVNKIFAYSDVILEDTLLVYTNGILQSAAVGEDYVVDYNNKTITFEYAPEASDKILVYGAV